MMVRTTEYKAEYHHFIPRFLLRQFAALEQPPPTRRQRGRRPRSQRPQGQPPKDPFVNAIDLRKNALVQVSISREFGLVDMYRDQGYQNPRHIEDNLGKLEGHAGRIIKKASDTFKAGQTLELTRRERDTIRKFLFLMKYRTLLSMLDTTMTASRPMIRTTNTAWRATCGKRDSNRLVISGTPI
ncbi:unnamed protein product [Aspergillus oryzae]|nr:unnamed protein product [Aspergillus oryzae]GMF88598.1 unnamed protein product [Aspergillus oryzae]GMG06754.1 unnamed protein product [Aspergillus oryzae]